MALLEKINNKNSWKSFKCFKPIRIEIILEIYWNSEELFQFLSIKFNSTYHSTHLLKINFQFFQILSKSIQNIFKMFRKIIRFCIDSVITNKNVKKIHSKFR